MLARIQRFLILTLFAATAGAAVLLSWRGLPVAALLIIFAALTGHAWVLALEFALMHWINRADPSTRATAWDVGRAWWGEIKSAPIVFAWRQPFRHQLYPDQCVAALPPKAGLLLVHGFFCNRGLWNRWMPQLRQAGVPFVALSLEPVFGSIDEYRQVIEGAVQKLEAATGQPPVVVAHSMGGLAVRCWWAGTEPQRIKHLVTIGTPHHGTWLARWAMSTNARQMRPHSRWLQTLSDSRTGERAARTTCFYSHCDNIVFPASTATLEGADNRHLTAVAHVHMADHPAPFAETMRLLEVR